MDTVIKKQMLLKEKKFYKQNNSELRETFLKSPASAQPAHKVTFKE